MGSHKKTALIDGAGGRQCCWSRGTGSGRNKTFIEFYPSVQTCSLAAGGGSSEKQALWHEARAELF